MIERRVARRYARALINTAETPRILDGLRDDMHTLQRAIHASHELRVFLRSPVIKAEKKKTALTQAFGAYVTPATSAFIELLCDKRRERVLPEIVEEFGKLYDLQMGIERPTVTTAVELSDSQRTALEAKLASRLGKKIEPVYTTDKTVLGGVRIRLGDTMIDGSVSHQLRALKEKMLNAVG